MRMVGSIDVVPLWAVFACVLVGILMSVEAGYRVGLWRHRRATSEKETTVVGMVTTELGLLAFMLAVTFSLAASRFDDRRRVLLEEANAIGTCYLRAEVLPAEQASAARRLLREYVDVRLAGVGGDRAAVEDAIRQSEAIHPQLWSQATAAARKEPRSVAVGLFIASLNEVIDAHARRLQSGLRSRLPEAVWVVLFGVAVLSFFSMGYHGGLTGTNRSPAVLAMALSFASVIWLTVDLERAHEGMLRISQQPMIDLRASMSPAQPATAGPASPASTQSSD